MAHFFCSCQGTRGQATRLGDKGSGVHVEAAGWNGCIDVRLYRDEDTERDMFIVRLKPWGSSGGEPRVIAEGVLDSGIKEPYIPALIA